MRMNFTVEYADGRTVTAKAKPKDLVALERQYGISVAEFDDATHPPRIEFVFYLAWSPLHRGGQEPRAFDEFLDHVDDVTPIEEEPVIPFEKEASAEPSPGSASEPASPPTG